MMYVILAVVAAFLALGGVAKCEHGRAETATAEAAAAKKLVKSYQDAEKQLRLDVKAANDATAKRQSDETRRRAAADAAVRKADAATASVEKRLQALLAEQPAYPGDTCKSACSALRQPLQ